MLTVAALAFGASRSGSVTQPSASMPPTHARRLRDAPKEPMHNPHTPEFFREQVTAHWASDDALLGAHGAPTVRLWLRFADPVKKDVGLLPALLDAAPPPVWCALAKPAPVASVTTHMQLLRDPSSLPGEHPWYLYESTATHMGDGHSDIQGRLWHEDGGLCGLITQHIADFSSSTRA